MIRDSLSSLYFSASSARLSFTESPIPVPQRRQLFIRAHNETLSVVAMWIGTERLPDFAFIKIQFSLTIEPNERPKITMKTLILAAFRCS